MTSDIEKHNRRQRRKQKKQRKGGKGLPPSTTDPFNYYTQNLRFSK